MAQVIKTEKRFFNTNHGNYYFNLYYIDEPVTSGTYIHIDSWYPFLEPFSIFASYDTFTTFESTNKLIRFFKQSSKYYLSIYVGTSEHSSEVTISNQNACAGLQSNLFIGTNNVAFIDSNIWRSYSINSTTIYKSNTTEKFGIYSRPQFESWGTYLPTDSNISVANVILGESAVMSTDPYNEGGITDGSGGKSGGSGSGSFDNTSDEIDIPDLPTYSAVDTGFISIFNPSLAQLKNLANYMWSNDLFNLDTWKKIFDNPMDAILGLSIVPVAVPEGGTADVTVGNIITTVSMTKASIQYVKVDCGSINVSEYWGGYMDYAPYTKAELYLPYCGTHPLNIDDIMGKTVQVVYHVDILSGACVAYVKCGTSVLYSFVGQCSSSIPITAGDMTSVINGILSISASVGTMVATGGMSAPITALVGTQLATSTASNVMNMKPHVEKSGSMSGTGGMLGIQTPYLIITRPKQCLPSYQNTYTGYPSYITSQLSSLSGFTTVDSIHLSNMSCTDEEKKEIENLLQMGVIL